MPDGDQIAAARAPTVQQSTPALNLHQRLHAVMVDVDYVQKDRAIGNKYKVVTHDAVTAKVRPALVKHRVAYYPQNMTYVQNGNRTEMKVDIHFVNIDAPSDSISVPSLGYGIDDSDKGPGKALSYAVKMALLKALGLETGEDADDDTDQKHDSGDVSGEFISPDQEQKLAGLIKETKADTAKFLKFLGCRAIYEIPASQFQQAVNALEAKKKQVAA